MSTTTYRDWEALRKDIEELGSEAASVKNGYSSVAAMSGSIRHHNTVKKFAPEEVSLSKAVGVQPVLPRIGKPQQKEIPDEIEKQLLSIEMLPVDHLIIDRTFQREEDTHRIRLMADRWNWLACGTLAVNLRKEGGVNYYSVIDGQQRLATIKLMGYSEAPCRVYVDLTRQQEAELFELLNHNKKPSSNDIFKSRLARGERVANAIQTAVTSVGYHLDPDRKHSGKSAKDVHYYIQSMPSLEAIYKIGGVIHVMDTLRFINSTWGGEYLQQPQTVLAGVSIFLKDYPNTDRKEMIAKAKKVGIIRLIQVSLQWAAAHGRATGSSSRGVAFSEAMLSQYNYNRQEGRRISSKRT